MLGEIEKAAISIAARNCMFVAIVAAAFRLAYLTCALHAAFAAAGFAITSLGMSLGAMASVG